MIQWEIADSAGGYPSRSYSSQQTFATSYSSTGSTSEQIPAGSSIAGSYTSEWTEFSVFSLTTIETASTATDGAKTRYTQSSFSYSTSNSNGYTTINPYNTGGETYFSSSTSATATDSSSESYTTVVAAVTFVGGTSTTISSESIVAATITETTNSHKWQTVLSTNQVGSSVVFQTVSSSAAIVTTAQTTQIQTLTIFTEESGDTITLDRTAIVYQAHDSEILWSISELPTAWNGYVAATNAALTATRATIFPKYSTLPMSAVASTVVVSTVTVPEVVTTITHATPISTQATTIVVNRGVLPNSTTTQTTNVQTTTTATQASTIFYSDELLVGFGVGQPLGQSSAVTSTTLASYGQNITTFQSFVGTMSFSDTKTITTSAARTITQFAVRQAENVSASSSFGNQSETSAITYTEQGVIQVLSPVVSNVVKNGLTQRACYNSVGVALGTNRGLYFTANQSGTADYAHLFYATAGEAVAASTVMPQTNASRTISSNSVSWTTSTARQSDTQNSATTQQTIVSAVLEVSGQTQTALLDRRGYLRGLGGAEIYNANQNGLGHFGGGSYVAGQTVIEMVPSAGAFRNVINGSTTSWQKGATAFTESEAAPIRKWEPVANFTPLENRLDRGGTVWTERRNIHDYGSYFTSLTG